MHIYKINEKSILNIEDQAYEKLLSYRSQDKENGGVLLGCVFSDYSQIFITDISVPSRHDKRGKYFFIRNKNNAQRIINANWHASNGSVNYLGEWHTHPEIFPTPSATDKKLIYDCLHKNKNVFDGLFLIIVGTTGHLYIGYQNKNMEELNQLYEIK